MSTLYRMELACHGFARPRHVAEARSRLVFPLQSLPPNSARVVAASVLAPSAIDSASVRARLAFSGEADTPKVERLPRRTPQRVGNNGANGSRRIYNARADGCGNRAKTRNELGENLRRKGLVPVALGHFGRIVHFDHERVCASSDRLPDTSAEQIHEGRERVLGRQLRAGVFLDFKIGTALKSSVYRAAVSNVRMPRSHRITFGLPSLRMYSALMIKS